MKKILPGLIVSLIFFLLATTTLSHYGMHEDSPFHFLRGQSYLQKILTGQDRFSNSFLPSPVFFIPGQRISLYKPGASEEIAKFTPPRPAGLGQDQNTVQLLFKKIGEKYRFSFYAHDAWGANFWDIPENQTHPAVSDILMAIFNRIFYSKLRLIGDVEAYHLYVVFVSSLCLFFLYLFVNQIFGQPAAFFSTAAFALFPYFFAESHFNVKDPVQMSFFTISIISFYFWLTHKLSFRWFILLVFSTFLALGTKWNIFFAPVIIFPWLILILIKNKQLRKVVFSLRFLISAVAATLLPFLLLIVAWPFLWSDPLLKLLNTFLYYSELAFHDIRLEKIKPVLALPLGLDGGAFLRVIGMTPPLLLIFFLIGIFTLFQKRSHLKYHQGWLIILWFFLPILRMSFTSVAALGSIRNYIEFLPAMMVIVGLGAANVFLKAANFLKATKNLQVLLFLIFTAIFIIILKIPLIKTHPNENVYFNFLVGGAKGARDLGIYSWETSYDNVYRQATNWLNQNALPDAHLAFLDGTMFAISPLWLRDDIRLGSFFSGFEQKGEYIASLIYPDPPSVFEYHYLENFLRPLLVISLDDVPLLKIWQNSPKYLKVEDQEKKIIGNFKIEPFLEEDKIMWKINLGRKIRLTRLILEMPKKQCTDRNGLWQLLLDKRGRFIVPHIFSPQKNLIELNFPGEFADQIRFWDVEGNSCLYSARFHSLYGL